MMDRNCDYLVYNPVRHCDDGEPPYVCPMCDNVKIQDDLEHNADVGTPKMQLEETLSGSMAQYVDIVIGEQEWCALESELPQSTTICYVKQGSVVSLKGRIHMKDVPPSGTWLSTKQKCDQSVSRLRLAGMACVHLPELN